MAKGVFVKGWNQARFDNVAGLFPTDENAEEIMRIIALGGHVLMEDKSPRNMKQHRKFYALMDKAFSNQEEFASRDDMIFAMEIRKGYADRFEYMGMLVPKYRSLAPGNMDQVEFNKLYDDAMDWLAENFGWVREEFEREIVA